MKEDNIESAGLISLRHIVGENARQAQSLECLKTSWPYFVGHGNSQISYPISIKLGLLLVGCHNSSVLEDFRKSARKTWPVLRSRINSLLKLHLRQIEVVPCDPEQSATPKAPTQTLDSISQTDPLELVLLHYRNSKVAKI
ncbi:MAG: hypothetical protein FWG12_00715 [Holophagaceae bacterium]|nr:hypothetical protein [Holophagaceae bacterium]